MQFSEMGFCFCEHVDCFLDVGDVGFDGDGVAAEGFDFADKSIRGFRRVGVVDDHVGAAAGEFESGFTAHATAWRVSIHVAYSWGFTPDPRGLGPVAPRRERGETYRSR